MKESVKAHLKKMIESVEPVEVLRNSLSREEADEIVNRGLERNGPRMSLAETLAHAAQFQQQKQTAE